MTKVYLIITGSSHMFDIPENARYHRTSTIYFINSTYEYRPHILFVILTSNCQRVLCSSYDKLFNAVTINYESLDISV